jgi:hypothetical protein
MAELTITVAVTTGTQYVTGSTGSIYTFDGSQPASFTFPWVQGGTVRLEQSGSSNDGHPLIFSTSNSSTLSTMKAGIISSGVTYYLDGSSNESDYTNTTTFNAATTRYIEIAPASQTDFYFACWVHGIGMGGIVDLTQNTWGALSWNDGAWNEQNDLTVSLSGLSATTALGTVVAFPEQGWGRDTWGSENWGESAITVSLTGLSLTSTLGSPTPGWGDLSWGTSLHGWGYPTIPQQQMGLTGVSVTSSVGSPTVTPETFASLTGVSATTSVGSVVIGEGIPLTGVSATTSLGTPTIDTSLSLTLTGVSAETDVGTLTVTSNPTVQPTGVSATTSVGSLVVGIGVPLTGVSATGSTGSITVSTLTTVELTGVSATITLGTVSPIHYKADTITGYTAYSVETLTA